MEEIFGGTEFLRTTGKPRADILQRNDELHAEATKGYLETLPRATQKELKAQQWEHSVRVRFETLPKTSRKYASKQLVRWMRRLRRRYSVRAIWECNLLAEDLEKLEAKPAVRDGVAA
jgi:hypothetical protein